MNRLVIVAAAVGVVALIVGIAIGSQISTGAAQPIVSVMTSTISSTQTIVQPLTTTITSTLTQIDASADCQMSFNNGTFDGNLILNQQNSKVAICVRYWYYNSTNALAFSPLNAMEILGYPANSSRPQNETSLFMITSSTDELQIGGPQVLNEGVAVNYTISLATSLVVPSGTYLVSLAALLYPQWANCGGIFMDLIVRNGTGNIGNSCINVPKSQINQYGFLDGVLFVEITGETNEST